MGPVYTNGSEYLASIAAGSLETGIPLLLAPLNWNLGTTRENRGATACIHRKMYDQIHFSGMGMFLNLMFYVLLSNGTEKLTPTIGWAGFTRRAGEVNTIPSNISSTSGREAA